MYAIVDFKGFQFRVAQDEVVRVPLLDLEPGEKVVIDRVLFLGGTTAKVGTPTVDGSQVEAEVVAHGRDKKVLVGKFIRRRDYHRKNGHRQGYTDIKINKIVA
jgi:large subunit ribosomal protein L21